MKLKKQSRWTGFLARQKFSDENVIPLFLSSKDSYVQFLGDKLAECGNFIKLAQCGDCGTEYYRGFSRCKKKFCANCEHTKGGIWLSRIMQGVEKIKDQYDFYFLTLTVTSQSNLKSMISTLERAWRYLKHDSKTYRKMFSERFVGGLRSLEVKWGKGDKGWHAHYHCLLIATKGFQRDIDWIREAWHNATDGLGTQPYIKKIKTNKLVLGILETCKYMVKFDFGLYDDDKIIEMVYSLDGKRRVNTFGILYGLGARVEQDIAELETKEKTLDGFMCEICGSDSAKLIIKHLDSIYQNYYRDFVPQQIEEAEIMSELVHQDILIAK